MIPARLDTGGYLSCNIAKFLPGVRLPVKSYIKTICYWLGCWACRVLCILFFRLRFEGLDNVPDKGPVVLISNHQSFLDPLFCGVGLKRQLHFMARDTLFTNRFFGAILSSVKAVPVKRGRADLSAIKKIIAALNAGGAACLFPEGTRTTDGRIADFKPGFGLVCRKSNAPIVPVLIDGAFERWPKGERIFSPGPVVVCYGKAITGRALFNTDDKTLATKLTNILRSMQNDCRLRHGKQPYIY